MKNLKTIEGFWVGYEIKKFQTPLYAPLEYMARCNPKTQIFPRGFRQMLVEHCPEACWQLKQDKRVYGFKTRDILEQDFRQRNKW